MRGCTIVARNYLAQARVLAASFIRQHPDSAFTILIVDDLTEDREKVDGLELLHLSDLALDEGEIYRMPMLYDVTEFSTAVKPWLLRRLLGDGADVVLYFDPDIEIFSPLDRLIELAREHSIVLTPHVTEPIPQDDRLLSESDILGAGIYNLGFIGVGPGSEAFLDWWASRLRRESVIDPGRMRFTDQRWIDFVPGLFRHFIVREPEFNVAYWNLHGRMVTQEESGYRVNGRPLCFFHYSGYSPKQPHILSKHQGVRPRILLSEQRAVRRLCDEYREKLLAAGFGDANQKPYAFEYLSNGLRLDQRIRRAYREALERFEKGMGTEPPSPFAPQNESAFLRWLNEPMGADAPGITRYILAVHNDRADLQAAFPDPVGAQAAAYYTWFLAQGLEQEHVHPSLFPPATAQASDHKNALTASLAGSHQDSAINVAGYFRAELGIGEAARLLLAGLDAVDLPYQTVSCTETVSRQDHPFQERAGEAAPTDINIVCVNADQTPAFANKMGPDFFRGRYTIGLWFWEVEEFPAAFWTGFDFVDEIWVATEFVRKAVGKVSPKPVYKFHLPLVAPGGESIRKESDTPKPFTFLFSFDFMSVLERKNPFGAIEAFQRAFQASEGPVLLIKTINGEKKPLDLERLKIAAQGRSDIAITDGYISAAEKDALMARCDCYVSLHRSEGYGLTMAEAMSLGKPVIATGYSGNLEFMTQENSYLCSFEFCEVGPDSAPYPSTARWAEPNLAEAAAFMRHVYLEQDEARARGRRAAEDIRKRHSPAVAGQAIAKRIASIRGSRLTSVSKATRPTSPTRKHHSWVWRLFRRILLHFLKEERIRLTNLEAAADAFETGIARSTEALRRGAFNQQKTRSSGQNQGVDQSDDRLQAIVSVQEQARENVANEACLRSSLEKRLQELAAALEVSRDEAKQDGELVKDLGDALEKRLEELTSALEVSRGEAKQESELVKDLRASAEHFRETLSASSETVENIAQMQRNIRDGLERRLDVVEKTASHAEAGLALREAAPFMANPDLLHFKTADGKSTIGYRGLGGKADGDDLYLGFENVFRGSEEMIRERQRFYLDFLRGHRGVVVDLGCGRGEMLDLLKESAIPALGVDLDPGMVARSRGKGHSVLEQGALPYLADQPDGSIGGIFCAQVIEHLAYEDLLQLLRLARKKLEPGGVLILETVNPHSPRALKTFWVDLTHNKPIFPEVLVTFCREMGYEEASVSFPNGKGEFEENRLWEGEYAVIAHTGRDGADF
ncbi:MAG: methyltransferase domain-containing protein [Chthoniobacterales bacterium]